MLNLLNINNKLLNYLHSALELIKFGCHKICASSYISVTRFKYNPNPKLHPF